MIPKKLHFCWYGNNPKNELIKKCILSWKKMLPDYEIIEWNEDNFDIASNSFVEEAYKRKKWAFVSDYVRLYALEKYGGIYLDTDVEMFKPLDPFLEHGFFSGFEVYEDVLSPITAVMGAEKQHPLIVNMLASYKNKKFTNANALIPNTKLFTDYLIKQYKVDPHIDKYQALEDNIHIYPSTFFCNYDGSESNYCVHHFEGSWVPKWKKLKYSFLRRLHSHA